MRKRELLKKAFGAWGVFLLFTGMGVQSGWASPGTAVPPVYVNGSEQYDRQITGRVTDTAGEPVIGANVFVKGTTRGVVTDSDGNFSIEAQPGSRIEISFIGMRTKTILLTGETHLTVTLAENSELLNEVVVVGYGTQKKANLTGAVASVSSDVLESRPITNLSQGLQGMIGNLNISADNGAPGKGYGFNVRGTTSINSAGPLVLVDGVQMDPNMINPADVESISVLKDAASASIYGTQAAYGVVLITTKKGKDEKPTVSLSANWAVNSPTRKPEYLDSWTFANFHNLTNRNSGGNDYYDKNYMEHIYAYYTDPKHNLPVFIDPSNPNKYLYCGNTDWIDETVKDRTLMQQYTVSVNGRSDKASYYGSIGFLDQGGTLKHYNDKYRRFNVNLNLTSDVTNWLQLRLKTVYNNAYRDAPYGSNSDDETEQLNAAFYGADLRPMMPVYHPDGHFSGQGSWTNMVATQALSGERKNKENDLWLTGGLKLTPLKNWTVNVDYTFNMYILSKKQHGKEIQEHTANPDIITIFPHTTPSRVKFTTDDNYYQTFNVFTDYSRAFGRHNVKVLAGYNFEKKSYRWFNAERENLISNDLAALGQAYGEKYNGSGQHSWATMGYFARINYNYAERYLLELNGRYDGSSKFPKNNRFVFFPSVSAAWRISQEAFFEPLGKTIDELKLRVSYGTLGNQSVGGDYPYIATLNTNGEMDYLVDGKKIAHVRPGSIVSPFLTWETVRQTDIGIDWGMGNNRFYGTFDWYTRKTLDMVTDGTPLPAVLGTGAPQANTADLKTIGWELSAGWRDRINKDFSYEVSLVLSDYQSEITRFNNPQKLLFNGDDAANYTGRKWGEIWGFVTDGLFQSAEEVASHADQSEIYGGAWYPGDVKYRDLDNDGKITKGKNTYDDPGDRKVIGNSEPRYSYGVRGALQWKDFDFDLFVQGIGKKDLVLSGNQFWGFGNEWHVPFKHALDSWTEENRGAYFPRSTYDNVTGNRETQTRYLQNGAYWRLKSVTLGYTLPESLTGKWYIRNVRFYISGQNLLTFDHLFDIYDPETVSVGTYPLTKSVSFGLNITL